jgi:aminopeptidase-like protein
MKKSDKTPFFEKKRWGFCSGVEDVRAGNERVKIDSNRIKGEISYFETISGQNFSEN